MLQQLVITTHDKTSLRPLLESAIENQKNTLNAGLARTQARLTEFEQRYGLPSAEFYRRFQAGQTDDRMDYVEWASLVQMADNAQKRLRLLTGESLACFFQPPR